MTTLSLTPPERARKTETTVLQRLQPVGTQSGIAVSMGCSDSTITRLKEKLYEFALVLAYLGLKVVPVEYECTHPGELSSLRRLRRVVEDHAPHLLDVDGS